MKWWIAVMSLVTAAALGVAVAVAVTMARAGDVSQLQSQVTALRAELEQEQAKLNAQSVTGDLITCADVQQLDAHEPVSVSGSDSYGTWISLSGGISGSWVPAHCYKP